MKHVVLIGFILLASPFHPLKAGNVIPLADGPDSTGKLSLSPTAIHVEGSSEKDINLPDILEADFAETPFELNSYFSGNDKDTVLPPGWAAAPIGPLAGPGSETNAGGAVSLKGSTLKAKPSYTRNLDSLFFAGCPSTGNFQWTAHLAKIDPASTGCAVGVMLRDSLDPGSVLFLIGTTLLGNGAYGLRTEVGRPLQFQQVSIDVPAWLRLTRYGPTVFASSSTDGKQWDLVGQNNFPTLANPLIGLFTESHSEKEAAEAAFDQLSLTPVASSGQVLSQGVILQSGSFLAGTFEHLAFDAANPDLAGLFRCGGKPVSISRSKISSVLMLPTTREQIAAMNTHAGLLMKNGDIQDGDFDSIDGTSVEVNSVLLGISVYNRSEVRGCFLKPQPPSSAPYQFRLRNGSIVNADTFTVNGGKVVIQDASGVSIPTTVDAIAQFRAGPAQAQPLAELNWKATPPPAAANAPPPAPAPVDDGQPLVQSWAGPNQEQVLMASPGTAIEFPLTGKFRAMGVKVALSSDSPPNSQITIRVLADGREIGHSPPFKAGDQPRFMEIGLQNPKTVTLQADSISTGAKVLFIDPVVIRDK